MTENDSAIRLRSLSQSSLVSGPDPSTQDETPSNSSRHLPGLSTQELNQHEELPSYSRAPPANQSLGLGHSTTLHRSGVLALLTVLFAALAVYSWVILAILSFRSLSTSSWQENVSYAKKEKYYPNWDFDARLYRSARVIQSILSVIILPWTSAVCAHAAVIFMQNQKDSMGLTLRQTMSLADRRWLDFSLLPDVLGGNWKKHGSVLLLLAIILHFLGAIIYPIQAIVVNLKSIHVPISINDMGSVGDLAHQASPYSNVAGNDVVRTRAALVNADLHTLQPQLWQGIQVQQLSNFKNFSAMSDPFYAQIPNGFHTGVLQQFAMRINSSATSRSIEAAEFPSGCFSDSSGFFANYTSLVMNGSYQTSWAVAACMPNDTSKSPWVETRDRQEFSESLYLNISLPDSHPGTSDGSALYEIILRTTAGYFELPNFMNNGTPGPLLERDPTPNCNITCMRQTNHYTYYNRARRDVVNGNETNLIHQTVPWSPLTTDNKGPLLTTALALFGPGSFIDTFFASMEVVQTNLKDMNSEYGFDRSGEVCIALAPMMKLFSASNLPEDTCISIYTGSNSRFNSAHEMVRKWLVSMYQATWIFPNAFTTAAFLSNKQWVESLEPTFAIYQDRGTAIEIPDISLAGMIVVSVLLGPYLLLLLALSCYGSCARRWTDRLDSFAMLRFGAALGEGIFPMLIAERISDIKELDEIPGVIRDVGPVSEDSATRVHRIGLWGGKPLQKSRRYECYEADNEAMTTLEVNQIRRGGVS
ncbi:hypothetical protein F1880_006821 [Penicillium rolfsii]|nr:hypothetical protein F1880_006821 [Penicillium rolfsii]